MDFGLFIFSLSIGTTYAAGYLRSLKGSPEKVSTFLDVLKVSCPGKVLVCGGYLVLDNANIGITIATKSARFYVSICLKSHSLLRPCIREELLIEVLSPQFRSTYKFLYAWNSKEVDEDTLTYLDLEKLIDENKNVFVQKCLSLSLTFIRKHLGNETFLEKARRSLSGNTCLSLTLEANNDFYSQVVEVMSILC
jgi:phosphomevalonate kinase